MTYTITPTTTSFINWIYSFQNYYWIDEQEVLQLLHMSSSTLKNHRANGTIRYSSFGGKLYYDRNFIMDELAKNMNR